MVSRDGDIEFWATNDLAMDEMTQLRNAERSWGIEQGYQQMKEGLGLDHHEGRSWRGFHHHACLVMLAFGFLALSEVERNATRPVREKRG